MKKFNLRRLLIGASVFVLSLSLISLFKEDIKSTARWMKINITGEDAFIKGQLAKQYPDKGRSAVDVRGIETSVLPIKLTTIRLSEMLDFASEGGSLATGEGYFYIADRLGNIYFKSNESIEKIKTPKIKNNISQYLLSAKDEMNSGQMRVHSIAYSSAQSMLYVCYTRYVNERYHRLVIDRIQIKVGNKEADGEWENIYESQQASASVSGGGKLLLKGKELYFSVGFPNSIGYPNEAVNSDWFTDDANQANSQDENSSFGKIYLINTLDKRLELVSLGHRNVVGLAFTSSDQLYSVEHGPQGGDELNHVQKGKNYGWPIQTYGTRYGTYGYYWKTPLFKKNQKISFTEPVFAFVPSVATSAVISIRDFNERWNNDLLVASLKGQSLYRIRMGKNGNAIYSEPIWIGSRLRDLGISESGVIYILTDDGQLVAMSVDNAALANNTKSNGLHFEKELKVCQTCHGFEATSPSSMAPSLSAVVNRKIGSDNFSRYSDSMKLKEGNWTQQNLVTFLTDPQSFVPGTTMPKLGLSESEAKKVVSILSSK